MTARELRLHLAEKHAHDTRGLMFGELVDLHHQHHQRDTDHHHDD